MGKAPKPFMADKSLKRKSPSREPIHVVHVFSEGKVTEKLYIEKYHKNLKVPKVILPPVSGGAGTPLKIVQSCIEKKNALGKAARKDASFEKNTSIWAVFDTDIHPYLEQALDLAKREGICVAISNPCIEVWGLMHINRCDKPLDRFEAQALLSKDMPGYHHEKSPEFPWDWCSLRVGNAILNSEQAILKREEEGVIFPKTNPTTNFHVLLRKLELASYD